MTTEHAKAEAPAEAGEPSLVDWFSQFIERHQEGCGSDTDALIACLDRVRDSYRAQPQAREDAQPVAWGPTNDLDLLRRAVAAGKNARRTVTLFSGPREGLSALYTYSAPDRVSEALSALVIADDHRPRGLGTPSDWIRNSYAPAIALARQALAALQQGAK